MTETKYITPAEARERYAVGTPKQVCDSVADLLETYTQQHTQTTWGSIEDCGTVACVAGWVGELHDDSIQKIREINPSAWGAPDAWIARQQNRLGISAGAGASLFDDNLTEDTCVYLLREISKWHASNKGGMLDGYILNSMWKEYEEGISDA